MLSWMPSCIARRSLVPTPSVPETSTGSLVALGYLAQRAEAAEAAQHFGAPGAARHALDVRDQGIAGVDIDARILVGKTVVAGFGHGRSPSLGRAILAAARPGQQTARAAV